MMLSSGNWFSRILFTKNWIIQNNFNQIYNNKIKMISKKFILKLSSNELLIDTIYVCVCVCVFPMSTFIKLSFLYINNKNNKNKNKI